MVPVLHPLQGFHPGEQNPSTTRNTSRTNDSFMTPISKKTENDSQFESGNHLLLERLLLIFHLIIKFYEFHLDNWEIMLTDAGMSICHGIFVSKMQAQDDQTNSCGGLKLAW